MTTTLQCKHCKYIYKFGKISISSSSKSKACHGHTSASTRHIPPPLGLGIPHPLQGNLLARERLSLCQWATNENLYRRFAYLIKINMTDKINYTHRHKRVLTRLQLHVCGDTDTDAGADTDTDTDAAARTQGRQLH